MGCLKNPKYSVFINGKPRGRITASRGIRQGDPLSPFLFLLVSEVLGEIINKLHINSQFEGFLVGKDLIHLPLLQFVDDTLLFLFQLPIIYLGLPLGGYARQKSFWQPVIDRIHKKLERWKRYNISRGGRQTLCNSVLVSLPTYYLLYFLYLKMWLPLC